MNDLRTLLENELPEVGKHPYYLDRIERVVRAYADTQKREFAEKVKDQLEYDKPYPHLSTKEAQEIIDAALADKEGT